MQILHVVTLVSQDGAFGGPLRVALNDCQQLAVLGHDVTLAAGWLGAESRPTELEGVSARLFPARRVVPKAGFSGLVSPQLQRWLRLHARDYDVVHLHVGRDLITQMASRRLREVPYVAQTHGMVPPRRGLGSLAWDRWLTQPCLSRAGRRYVLTTREAAEMQGQFPALQFTRLANGVRLPERATSTVEARPEVLYVARLQSRKRPVAFVQMAADLLSRGFAARFSLIGPDEGELQAVRAVIEELGVAEHVRYEGALPYADVLARMRSAAIYVLPSVDEPFPMTLLEALSVGLPSVCTDTCGIAEQLRELGAAVVTPSAIADLADAVAGLLSDEASRRRLGERAREVIRDRFSIESVATQLERDYEALLPAAL